MKRLEIFILSLLFFATGLQAQMYVNGDTLYGNEWINYDQSYYKTYITNNGMYRISYQSLVGSGVPVNSVSAENLQMFVNGEEIPIYTSNNNLTSGGYIEFYAEKNNGELDAHLYASQEHLFNPHYSMFTDSSAYFLTWNSTSANKRFAPTPNDPTGAAEPFFLHQIIDVPSPKYNKGEENGEQYESTFSPGEGFGSTFTNEKTTSLNLDNIYSDGSGAKLEMNFAAADGFNPSHNIGLSVNGSNITVNNASFNGYDFRQISQSLPTNLLSPTTEVTLKGLAGNSDQYSTAFVKITYPSQFKFGNNNTFKFTIPASSTKKNLEITDFDFGGTSPILYDLTNGLRIVAEVSGSTVKVGLPASNQDRELVLVSQSAATAVGDILAVNFTNYFTTQGDFIMLAHNKFMQGSNYIQQYADYRQSKGYQPVVIDINELYDQFAYGVSKHSISVRNLTGFSLAHWTNVAPKYIFMVGKSRPYYSVRLNWNAQPAYTPTFGHDPSDNLLTATISSDIPRIPIGRIPVTTADEVRIYLNKVQAFENNQNLPQTIEDKAWMKRIIHLGGGDVAIQTTIKNNLEDYAQIVENDYYGGQVSSFFKNSSDPIQISTSDLLDSLINDGTSLITFNGHSSPGSFDFNLDAPANYENQDRYPLIFSLGCFSGQIHQKAKNLGEQFVFEEDKGAIAFLATVSLSGLPALDKFADRFYRKLSVENYGEGIGDLVKATITELVNSNSGPNNRIVYQQMTLNGDPSIRLNTSEAPDFIVKKSSIAFDPATPDANDDFDLTFSVTNIGRSTPDQFKLLIERILPNGIEIPIVDEMVDSPDFEQEYSYNIEAVLQSNGLNQFRITVDANKQIIELPGPTAEENNIELAELFIFSDDIEPVYPYDFSIIGTGDDLKLKASTANAFADEFSYQFEIDTTESFNSPIKTSTAISQGGGLIEWEPSIPLINNAVYYWRVRVDPDQVPDALGWRGHSFVYIDGEYPGWNQSHYYQFKKNRFNNIKYPSRRFEFVDDNIEVIVKNAHLGVLLQNEIDYSVNGSRIYDVEGCEKNQQGMYIVLFDQNISPLENTQTGSNQGLYNTYLCKSSAPAFLFPTDTPQGRTNLQNFLTGILPNSDASYALAYSLNDYVPQNWEPGLFNAFAARGFSQIPTTIGAPYAGMIDLTNNSTIGEESGSDIGSIIEPTFTIQGDWTEGNLVSTIVGPASEWISMHWDVSEQGVGDEVSIDVYGITFDDERVLLINNLTEQDYIFDGSIDASQYPRLQLQYDISDPVSSSAPQLEYWRVLYDELPDVALRPDLFFAFESDTIRRGENLKMSIAVQNIGRNNMDSLLMNYSVINRSNNTVIFTDRLRPLSSGDTLIAWLDVATKRFVGNNQLVIEANPNDDQPESTHVNNIAIRPFFVEGDRLNPILDVTFDGQHILDGDIVSANPNILISLRDENEYLELADTSLFKILIKYPGESSLRQVSFDSDAITFYPAEREMIQQIGNKAVIEFNPHLLQDGIYQLFVQAEDVSGNQSGDLDYKVSFEVVSRTGITNVLNYPNPFTSSTRFVFTLTGATVPDYMKIQIMTVTGKVVREITMDELGDLHVGNNITDFAWDGTDQYGDQLANGVYLYRVVTKNVNGEEYERFQNNTNQYFKNGYGKMYLMR